MWTEINEKARSILLVGECNFSFTKSLLRFIDRPSRITSTCFETDPEGQPRKANISLLREKGVHILLGVDATKLQENENLKDKYDYVIFNFPHIGGKSRIHLNRELLSSFFISASNCLSDEHDQSFVIITLCQGQGGVLCDHPRRPRAYGDTWKVVEMAAHGGLILKKVQPFQSSLFPGYFPSGYGKHGDKGFHLDGSLTYIFCRARPLRDGLPQGNEHFNSESLHKRLCTDSIQTHFGLVTCSRVHARLYCDSPVTSAPFIHIVEYLMEKIDVPKILNADEKAPLHISDSMINSSFGCGSKSTFSSGCHELQHLARCTIEGLHAYLRNSLVYCLQHLSLSDSMAVVIGHVFHELNQEFSIPPVGTEVMVSGKSSVTAMLNLLTKLAGGPGQCILRVFNDNVSNGQSSSQYFCNHLSFEIISMDQMLILGHLFLGLPCVQNVCTVNLDNVALIVYKASDWRELRVKCCQVVSLTDNGMNYILQKEKQVIKSTPANSCEVHQSDLKVRFIPESLYPPTFTFDVCFSEKDAYSEKDFWYLLWHLVGDLVTIVELIDCYQPLPERVAEGHQTSWCFRLKYCSYEWPLYRKSAVRIQNEVVNWGLVNILGVGVK